MLVGHVANSDHSEIGEASFWADGREFRIVYHNFVAGKLIRPGFNLGESEVQAGSGMLRRVAGSVRHESIVMGVNWVHVAGRFRIFCGSGSI